MRVPASVKTHARDHDDRQRGDGVFESVLVLLLHNKATATLLGAVLIGAVGHVVERQVGQQHGDAQGDESCACARAKARRRAEAGELLDRGRPGLQWLVGSADVESCF